MSPWLVLVPVAISVSTPAWAARGCETVSSLVELREQSARGEAAFANLDMATLEAARADAMARLPCVQEVVGPGDAAAFHRLMGLYAFASGDRAQVAPEFHAARKLEPGYTFPEHVAPPGHPLIEAYSEAAQLDEGDLQFPIAPRGGWINVGGVRGAPRGVGSAAVLQVFEADGAIVETLYLPAGYALPTWGRAEDTGGRQGAHIGLISATGGTALAAAGLYAVARGYEQQFQTTDDAKELEVLQARTNGFAAGAIGAGLVSLGLVGVTVLTW